MTPETMNEILHAVKHAREKHPHFADDINHAVCLAIEELGEMAKSINDNKPWNEVCAEAYDTIAVLVRILEEK